MKWSQPVRSVVVRRHFFIRLLTAVLDVRRSGGASSLHFNVSAFQQLVQQFSIINELITNTRSLS